ncbi:YkgJ family cysteine cluster protein [Vibrio breoganii]
MKIAFGCNHCSECCHGSISITLDEVMSNYAQYFPIGLSVTFLDVRNAVDPIFSGGKCYKRQKKYLMDNYSFAFKGLGGRKLLAFPEVATLIGSNQACPNLLDGRCGIYDDRPSVCRLYPYQSHINKDDVGLGLVVERSSYLNGDVGSCQGFDSDVIFFTGEMPAQIANTHISRTRQAKLGLSIYKKVILDRLRNSGELMSRVEQATTLDCPTGERFHFSLTELSSHVQLPREVVESNALQLKRVVANSYVSMSEPKRALFKSHYLEHKGWLGKNGKK